MVIQESEIKEIKTIGTLNGQDVKVIVTKGGFCAGLGVKKLGGAQPEALAAASHPGIVKYQIEKAFGAAFKPALCKSEADQPYEVEDKTANLPQATQDAGFELYILSKSNSVDFVMSKNGLNIAKYEASVEDQKLNINDFSFRESISPNRFVSDMMGKLIADKAKELGVKVVPNVKSN